MQQTTFRRAVTGTLLVALLGVCPAALGAQSRPPAPSQADDRYAAAPLFLDELTPRMLSSADLGYAAPLVPTSIALRPDGTIVLGTSVAAVELDLFYQELGKPGREIFTEERIAYAFDVTVTDAGTLFARAPTGGQVFVMRPDVPRHQRIQTGIDIASVFVASADGSLTVADATQRRAVRVQGRTVEPLDIFAGEYSWVQVAAAGPEATLWVWDAVSGTIGVYTTAGEELERIAPQVADRGTVKSLAVLPDGDFIMLSMLGLFRFDRSGNPLWHLESMPAPAAGSFNEIHRVAVDPVRGYIYLLSISGQRVIRLIDPEQPAQRSALERELIALNARIAADSDDATAHARRAALYRDAGASALEAEAWRAVLDIDPFDQQAAVSLAIAEGRLMLGQAKRSTERTLETLRTLGPESGRAIYSVTLQLYEQAASRLHAVPDERRRAQDGLDSLRREFERLSRPRPAQPPPRIQTVNVSDVFPALIRHYHHNPLGTVTITNDLDRPIEHLTLRSEMRYADVAPPAAGPLRLAPGESAALPLYVLLSPEALLLQEDIPVAMRIVLNYVVDGVEQSTAVTHVVTMRRNTSLYWDDSGKLASFITPNDTIVSDFALRAARLPAVQTADDEPAAVLLSAGALRAARIVDALGVFGINYVEDPDSPFTEVFGNPGRIDTVRFPRTTLRLRAGDCDETASLLASLLEAAGVRTAIMTSPGHVFVAFDSQEPLTNRWLYEGNGRTVVEHQGSLWLPVETTILERGFAAAWQEGSRLVRAHPGAIEFLPYYRERERYPSMPLPPASFDLHAPPQDRVHAANKRTRQQLRQSLYYDNLARIERQLNALGTIRGGATGSQRAAEPGGDSREAARLRNQIGVLHARSGDLDVAEEVFRAVVALHPDSAPGHLNLANVHLLRGDHAAALASAATAQRLRPHSAAAQLVRAQALHALGQVDGAREAIAALRELSPELGERYAYLALPEDALRAAATGFGPISAWERE
ncbi:MAG: hypothetical protein EA384_09040 [Spirochaetaceae bacterium]|nr:MAG: hypothetical protein EA384_09040 [Spirochaetaceae bacterium]